LHSLIIYIIQDSSKQKLPRLSARLEQIYVAEGVEALYAGIVPRTLWISAGGAILLGVYEWVVHGLMVYLLINNGRTWIVSRFRVSNNVIKTLMQLFQQ